MAMVEVFFQSSKRFALESGKLGGMWRDRMQSFGQLVQSQDGFLRKAVRTTHGYEVTAIGDLPMREVAAREANGSRHTTGPV